MTDDNTKQMDARDQLWNASFETYYDAYYQELEADALIGRWQVLDEITKLLVALTASGSAVAGWALWSQPTLKYLWALVAGLSAFLAIAHATLGVPSRLKALSEIRGKFGALRIDLETLRQQMQIDTTFPLDQYSKQHLDLRNTFKQHFERIPNDILLTRTFRLRVQDRLDDSLRDSILEEGR